MLSIIALASLSYSPSPTFGYCIVSFFQQCPDATDLRFHGMHVALQPRHWLFQKPPTIHVLHFSTVIPVFSDAVSFPLRTCFKALSVFSFCFRFVFTELSSLQLRRRLSFRRKKVTATGWKGVGVSLITPFT
jgi:hypothetical protein